MASYSFWSRLWFFCCWLWPPELPAPQSASSPVINRFFSSVKDAPSSLHSKHRKNITRFTFLWEILVVYAATVRLRPPHTPPAPSNPLLLKYAPMSRTLKTGLLNTSLLIFFFRQLQCYEISSDANYLKESDFRCIIPLDGEVQTIGFFFIFHVSSWMTWRSQVVL